MASTNQYGLFWNSDGGDRKYNAESFEIWLKKFFTSGVFTGDLVVTAVSGMEVSVSAGYANVDGKVRFFENSTSLTLAVASSSNPRIDTVVVERNDADRNIFLKVVQGAYAENPVATAPVREDGIYQLVIAEIYVDRAASSITQANITDKRTDATVCGLVTGTVEEIDFDEIYQQFTAWFTEYKADTTEDMDEWIATEQADFLAWYDHMKDQLDEDAAGHLQGEIDSIQSEIGGISSGKENIHSWIDYTLLASGWDGNGEYSFEDDYSSNEYDIDEILPQYGATEEQKQAWSGASCGGRYPTNYIKAYGNVPIIDIPVALNLVKRGGEE